MKKAVIPVAGLGTRFLPATKAIPKEMITLVDQPLIQYVVQEAVNAGFTDIILVTHSSKQAIENHFDHHFELEATLATKKKTALIQKLRDIIPDHINVISVRQPEPLGLGHAVLCAASVIGGEDFAVILPDVILNTGSNDLKQMVDAFAYTKQSQIMVEKVPSHEVDKYGIADCNGSALKPTESTPMKGIIEKPSPETAPSNLAVTGRYVLDNDILTLLKNTPKGAGNEIQLTDAIAELIKIEGVQAYCLEGKSYDCGDKLGYLKASVQFACAHPELGAEFSTWLKTFKEFK
ncbi:UTP--glucose-1-phosphate uridylyltransferase [hydrothermal vent metagenome]|uniref:UTP--glucose-1-phosphate uridylyltransferase n=1 Tax=hydrothermal vent metagenome TaxID=652676 RepID=A0A3B0W3G9_9ZZZZ